MFRFLILCIIAFLLYVGFMSISGYDVPVELKIFDYQLETSLFPMTTATVVCLLLLLIALKFIFMILGIPGLIAKMIQKNKLKKQNYKLLRSFSELLMGNPEKALHKISGIIDDIAQEEEDIKNLINACFETNKFEKKIQFLKKLIGKRHYSVFASKELASIYYKNSHFLEAEEYAVKAFNEDDTNTEILVLLIKIYAKRAMWSKLFFVVTKLKRANQDLFESMREEIAGYYYFAAKTYISNGEDEEGVKYLETALELKLDHIDALTLFIEIKTSTNSTAEAIKILKESYRYRPCFEIAELFIKSSKISPEAIYVTLSSIADPKQYNYLYLAIAAYLGLGNRIKELNEISHMHI